MSMYSSTAAPTKQSADSVNQNGTIAHSVLVGTGFTRTRSDHNRVTSGAGRSGQTDGVSELSGKAFLVVGATGALGSRISASLAARGAALTISGRSRRVWRPSGSTARTP